MLTRFPRVLAGLLIFAFLLPLSDTARGASPEPGDPNYHNLRYDDDFSYLADASQPVSPWDRYKYMPLGDGQYGPSYVSFGGELRLRFESISIPISASRPRPAMPTCCSGCCCTPMCI